MKTLLPTRSELRELLNAPELLNGLPCHSKPREAAGFDRLPIGGEWRKGKVGVIKDIDPYRSKVFLEVPQGDRTG
jgi:hypothetical protein